MSLPRGRCLVRISPTPLSLDEVVAFVTGPEAGGVATFIGTARTASSITPGKQVVRLEYEAYVPMAEALLHTISDTMLASHAIERIAIVHRTGTVAIGEPSILVAASARHRAPAFDACRAAVDAVKAQLPVWKKEVYADGGEWVGSGA